MVCDCVLRLLELFFVVFRLEPVVFSWYYLQEALFASNYDLRLTFIRLRFHFEPKFDHEFN